MYDSKNIILGYACTWVCPLPLARQESLIMLGFPISSLDIITIKNKTKTKKEPNEIQKSDIQKIHLKIVQGNFQFIPACLFTSLTIY